jgi:hypothetical protein
VRRTKDRLVKTLLQNVRDLPESEVAKVLAFAEHLREDSAAPPERGSSRAISRALDEGGSLHFEPGELDALLSDIEDMRNLDERG